MIGSPWTPSPSETPPRLDPALVAEIDDVCLREALADADLADRVVLATELLQRGLPI